MFYPGGTAAPPQVALPIAATAAVRRRPTVPPTATTAASSAAPSRPRRRLPRGRPRTSTPRSATAFSGRIGTETRSLHHPTCPHRSRSMHAATRPRHHRDTSLYPHDAVAARCCCLLLMLMLLLQFSCTPQVRGRQLVQPRAPGAEASGQEGRVGKAAGRKGPDPEG